MELTSKMKSVAMQAKSVDELIELADEELDNVAGGFGGSDESILICTYGAKHTEDIQEMLKDMKDVNTTACGYRTVGKGRYPSGQMYNCPKCGNKTLMVLTDSRRGIFS